MRIGYCGIRFFYVHVLARDWHILSILRAQNEHRLPAVLSIEEVRSILAQVKNFPHHVFLSTVYSCGLRLDEARHLEVSDIDSQRMMIHVHRAKGAKDRYVALVAACSSYARCARPSKFYADRDESGLVSLKTGCSQFLLRLQPRQARRRRARKFLMISFEALYFTTDSRSKN